MDSYFIYITTNIKRSFLFSGMTTDLRNELVLLADLRGDRKHPAGRNHCDKLLFFEKTDSAHLAVNRLKELKSMSRKEKEAVIRSRNPMWKFIELPKV